MKNTLVLLAVLIVAGVAWIRLAPSDPARWHVDPLQVDPGEGRFVVRPEGGDMRFGPFPESPEALLARLDRVAMGWPRTQRLAGTPEDGRVTYITRSRVFGFPDYTTVAALAVQDGTDLAILARLRFGRGDMGVNRARVMAWLDRL